MLLSKAGLVLIGFRKWQGLPDRIDIRRNDKANKFEAGLKRYIERTLGKAFRSFKNEF